MNKFDDEFDQLDNHIAKTGKRIGCAALGMIAFNAFVTLVVLGGLCWLAYILLKHFGVVG